MRVAFLRCWEARTMHGRCRLIGRVLTALLALCACDGADSDSTGSGGELVTSKVNGSTSGIGVGGATGAGGTHAGGATTASSSGGGPPTCTSQPMGNKTGATDLMVDWESGGYSDAPDIQ